MKLPHPGNVLGLTAMFLTKILGLRTMAFKLKGVTAGRDRQYLTICGGGVR